jgi:ATPase subunit of ABC transporter with duplicated ATPase domains
LEDIDPDTSCTELSGGQWTRVRLAGALGDGFLILDEPTNNLDRHGREAVLRLLRAHPGGLLLISHDREALEICEEVLELSSTGLARFGGGWSCYIEESRRERERLAIELDRAKRARDTARADHIEQQARQHKRNRRGSKSASRGGVPKIVLGGRKSAAQVVTGKRARLSLDRAAAAVTMAHEALHRMKSDPVMYADFAGEEIPAQKMVAEAHAFNVRFEHWVFAQDLDFSWRGNVRVALEGPNGSGKSTLLEALMHGVGEQTRGELKRGELATLYVDQRCSVLDDDATVLENVLATSSRDKSQVRNALARFLFAGDAVFQKARDLSGGERVRAALACGLLGTRAPQLMLLDEPTNNLDLANIEFLENVVSQFRGALVVISHDREFLRNCRLTDELSLAPHAATASTILPFGRGNTPSSMR